MIGKNEISEKSPIEKIFGIRRKRALELSKVPEVMMAMEAAAYLNNAAKAIERLHELVPDFHSPDMVEDLSESGTEWVEDKPVYSLGSRAGAGSAIMREG